MELLARSRKRDVAEILLEGLRRLEYRGYDSAGLAVVDAEGHMTRLRRLGKVQMLAQAAEEHPLHGGTGIAHTRWATHGETFRSERASACF
ncbi:glucosamine--fructose-6-phosphate aminotransferase [Escherichia coli]|uniref:Glutamine--fructose-6-phosphate aminotransferase [isomerizing] n=1 Tax=Escherichia coli TaxID=562 RepID=A0A376MM64_ECOLX|nr:glucosamine--fructose-6-phosphate aminotransferase [Escherichia coli]